MMGLSGQRAKHYAVLMLLFSTLAGLAGCTGAKVDPEADLAEAKTGIQKANDEFMAAVRARNATRLVDEYYSGDAMVLPPNQDALSGRDQIMAFFDGMLKGGVQDVTLTTDRVERNGDLAVEVGRYQMSIKPPQGEVITDNGKYVVVFRRQPDGRWKAKTDIFNSSVAPPPAK